MPSFFIRLSGCNLRCAWCDTPYTSWAPESTPRSIDDLLTECSRANVRHVVVTGGEPMIFARVPELARALVHRGKHITVETAGTALPTPNLVDLPCDLMSISPKLANSTPAPGDPRDPGGVHRATHERRRTNLPVLRWLIEYYPQRQLKFVVSRPDDLAEIDSLLAELPPLAPDDVLLMPEGVAPPTNEAKTWMLRACLARGWRYCPRLHIELFGHRRGT